jgi:uncharacterized membrane protein YqjE
MTVVNGRSKLRDRSTGDLVKDLSQQASRLVRQEIELAKTELAEKGKQAGIVAGLLAGAAVAALLMLGALTAFLILALDEAMPDWAAAIVVTLVWGAVAVVLALVGRQKAQEIGTPVPEKTVESVKEDIEWLKHPTN